MPPETFTILLVDDEPDVLQLVTYRLKNAGYRILTAINGQKALDVLASDSPHLILCDVVMPVLDGPTLCRELRAKGNTTPFLFLTAKGMPQDVVDLLSAGADDYIVKPFDAGELLARVKAILRRVYPSQ